MLVFSLIWSAIFLACTLAMARSRHRTPAVLGMGIAAFLLPPFCMFLSLATSLQAVGVCVATCVCAAVGGRARVFRLSMIAVTAFAYAVTIVFAVREARDARALAARYPFQSLAPRLAYETTRHQANAPVGALQATPGLNVRWDEIQSRLESGGRIRQLALEQLHEKTIQQFIESPSFGVGRMVNLASEWRLNRGDDPPVPQPRAAPDDDASPDPGAPAAGEPHAPSLLIGNPPAASDVWTLHAGGVLDFLSADRFGLVRSRDQVAGFLSHRFSSETRVAAGSAVAPPDHLELVSLLKFDEPRVYISENLPRMEELKDAATREINPFEEHALDALRRGEDMVTADEPRKFRALGALRALKQCLQCHTAEQGELLGAFSYTWRHKLAKPVTEAEPRPGT